MADEIDKANELADLHLQAALAAAKATGNEKLHYCGRCWNCDEPLEEGKFCDIDCHADFEVRQSREHKTNWR